MSDDARERARATLRTSHDHPCLVAAALRPDNTAEMTTEVVEGRVVTTIEREDAAGLRSTVDDYVVNLSVADRLTNNDTHDTS